MAAPTWLFIGVDFIQGMFRYMRDPLGGRAVGDVIGSAGSDYKQWATCGGANCTHGSRTPTAIYTDEDKPPVVVLALGSNPKSSPTLPAGFLVQVQTAVAQAGAYGAQVIAVGPFANDSKGIRLAAIREVVPDAIDGYALGLGLPREADGVHFTQAGYKTLTERFIAAIFAALDRRAMPGATPGTAAAEPAAEPVVEEAVAGEPIADGTAADVSTAGAAAKAAARRPYLIPLLVGGGVLVAGAVAYAIYRSRRRAR